MRKFLVLTGFLANILVGQVCLSQITYAAPVTNKQGQVMSRSDAAACPFQYAQMSAVPLTSSGGCPDGKCIKKAPPCTSCFLRTFSFVAEERMVPTSFLPVLGDAYSPHNNCSFVIDDPPIPPGVQGVVLRE
jgi:hypothetical protein